MRDVQLRGLGIAHGNGRVARGDVSPGASRIAEHPLGEIGEIDQILVHEGVAGAAEAAQPIGDVGGVAIVCVDAGCRLCTTSLTATRASNAAASTDPSAWRTSCGSSLGPRQAAGVGGEEALGAALHG